MWKPGTEGIGKDERRVEGIPLNKDYIQYAYARICSVLAQWGGDTTELADAETGALNGKHELALMSLLNDYSGIVESAARELSPHLIAYYLKDLAGEFHSYYNAEQFLVPDNNLRLARLALITAVRQVLRNGLALLDVGSPEKM